MNEPPREYEPSPLPTLNWEEREAGLMGQLPLPVFADVPTPAERVFIRLSRRWHAVFAAVEGKRTPPRVADELALAAVLLAREHGSSS